MYSPIPKKWMLAASAAVSVVLPLDDSFADDFTKTEVHWAQRDTSPANSMWFLQTGAEGRHHQYCTGFTAESRHIVVSNSHCVLDDQGNLRDDIRLYYRCAAVKMNEYRCDDSYYRPVIYYLGTKDFINDRKDDVVVLYNRDGPSLGTTIFHLDMNSSQNNVPADIQRMGYGSSNDDPRVLAHYDCGPMGPKKWRLKNGNTNIVITSLAGKCGGVDGASGSPYYTLDKNTGEMKVVAMHYGTAPFQAGTLDMAVFVDSFAQPVKDLAKTLAQCALVVTYDGPGK